MKLISAVSPEKVAGILKISQEPISIETPIGEEEDTHLGDFIEDRKLLSPVDTASHELLRDQITIFTGSTDQAFSIDQC